MKIVELILLCICGLILHFLFKWGAAWNEAKKQKLPTPGPTAFAMEALPDWLASIFGAIATMLMMRSLVAFLVEYLSLPKGVTLDVLLQVLAFSAGYMGSSMAPLAAQIVKLLFGKLIKLLKKFAGDDEKPA